MSSQRRRAERQKEFEAEAVERDKEQQRVDGLSLRSLVHEAYFDQHQLRVIERLLDLLDDKNVINSYDE